MNSKVDYDQIAKNYSIHRNASKRVVQHITCRLKKSNIEKFLEIGCGTADHLYALNQLIKKEAHGFDKSSKMISEGIKKNPELTLKTGDVDSKFPYENDYFDFAFSANVIHYIKNLSHYFSESCRVLRNKGIVLTVTDSEEDIQNRTMSKYFPESMENELKRYPSIEKIINEMGKIGFGKIETTHTDYTYQITEKELEKFKNKAYSALRLISKDCFEKGISKMTEDVKKGKCEGNELYTYVWGGK